jgi:hypothetical protein
VTALCWRCGAKHEVHPLKGCGAPPLERRDCECSHKVEVSPGAVLAWCATCWGWLRRPPEVSLRQLDRKARKRRAYQLAGLTQNGDARRRRLIGPIVAGQRG